MLLKLAKLLGILAVAHLAAFFLTPSRTGWIEAVHARGVFPLLRAALGTPLAQLPVSAGEVLVAAALLLLVAAFGQWVLVRVGVGQSSTLAPWLACTAALAVHLYLLGFGWLYKRPPLALRLDLPAVRESAAVAEAALASAKEARAVRCPPPAGFDVEAAGRQASEALGAVLPELAASPLPALRVKSIWPVGGLMSFGVSGVFSPFTFEPNVDPALDPLDLAFTAAHELAHAAGFAGEDEANFVAWLALTRSRHAFLRYAGHARAYAVLARALRGARAADLAAAAGPEVHADLERVQRAWERYRSPKLATIQTVTYDRMLRAQGVKSGIQSYGEMVQLLVAWRARAAQRGR